MMRSFSPGKPCPSRPRVASLCVMAPQSNQGYQYSHRLSADCSLPMRLGSNYGAVDFFFVSARRRQSKAIRLLAPCLCDEIPLLRAFCAASLQRISQNFLIKFPLLCLKREEKARTERKRGINWRIIHSAL